MGDCHLSAEAMSHLLSGAMTPEQLAVSDAHLRVCVDCQAKLDELTPTNPSFAAFLSPLQSLPGPLSTAPPGFDLLGILGTGKTATVYKAWQTTQGRVVALKILSVAWPNDGEAQRRFNVEIEAAASQNHPHIVQVLEVGTHQGRPFLVMEFCAGGNLAERLRDGPLPPRRAAALIELLARTLHTVHKNGFIHRDLKPANILFDGEEHPKVADFGVVKRLDAASTPTPAGSLLGTPPYLAPEQIDGSAPAGSHCDVYALGAIFYECLIGRPPFRAGNVADILFDVLNREPMPLRLADPRLPRDLETICLKCLEKEPRRRYPSAADLAADLRRWLRGEPIQARSVGRLGRLWRWSRRKPVVAGLIAALMLVLVGGFAGIFDQWRKTEAARREAVASDELGQQLLAELIRSGPVSPLHLRYLPSSSNIELLLKAEAYFDHSLEQRPKDTGIRVALTNVRGSLGTLYSSCGKIAEAVACFQKASDLWEALVLEDPHNPEYRDWMATTLFWRATRLTGQGDVALALRLLQRADAYWQELVEEQPDNMALLQKVLECRLRWFELSDVKQGGEESLSPLKESMAQLGTLVTANPANTVLCKRLALTCFLLGEIYHVKKAESEALPYWRQAHQLYSKLAESRPDDLLVSLTLGVCCSRLMGGQAADPCYLQAVSLLEPTGKRLTGLLGQYPDSEGVQLALRENYGCLIVCHWKASQTHQGENTFKEYKRLLDAWVREHPDKPKYDFELLEALVHVSFALEEAKQPAAALPIAREAATLADRCASIPSLKDRDYSPTCLLPLAALLRRLGDSAESLRQAEHAQRFFEAVYRVAPEVNKHGVGLSTAWQYIGKARWELGQSDAALAAFRESAAVQRQVFLRAPAIHQNRTILSRCYDMLIDRGGLRGNRAEVVGALQEQEKLWLEEPARLLKMARNYLELAAAVGQGKKQLSKDEQVEQQRYRDESSRLARLSRMAERASPSR